MTDIENTVLGIVQDTADYLDEPVLLSSRFMDIGINSVLFIKIIVNVEDTYDLEISEVEIVRLLEENVSSLAQYIQKEVAQNESNLCTAQLVTSGLRRESSTPLPRCIPI